MKKAEIIKTFNKLGYLLEPALLEYLEKNKEKIDLVLACIKTKKPQRKILSLEFVKDLILKEHVEIKILKERNGKKEMSVNDFLNFLNFRYEKIRNFLLKRMELINLISINKISQRTKNFSIIGIVLEKYDEKNSILIEDLTGQIEVFVKEKFNLIVEDEVIGIICKKAGDKIYAERIIFPDIPVTRKIKFSKKDCKIVFTFSNFLKKNFKKFSNFDVIFIFDKLDEKIAKFLEKVELISFFSVPKVKVVTDPCLIEIEGVKIFFSSGEFLEKYKELKMEEIKIIIELIKKRHLDPKIEKDVKEIYFLDPIPDIIAVSSKKSNFTNYKGVTIITCSPQEAFEVNLKTREISKLAF